MKSILELLLLLQLIHVIVAVPLEDRVRRQAPDCLDLDDIDDEFFFSRPHPLQLSIEPSSCMFYTRGLTKRARAFADTSRGLITIWDAYECGLYDDGDSSRSPNNPLRCIMDDGDRTEYFARMSRAYALQCGGLAMLMTRDIEDIPDDGIWARTERPTLERDSDFTSPRQLTSIIEACDDEVDDCDFIFQRSGLPPVEKILMIAASGTNREPTKRRFKKDLMARQDDRCFTPDELEERFDDLDW